MSHKNRVALGASLFLIAILLLFLFLSNRTSTEEGNSEQVASQPPGTAMVVALTISTATPTQTATAVPPTATPTSTPTTTPTPSPTPEPTPSPTVTPEPTSTPTLTPLPTLTPVPLPEWLSYLNLFRAQAGLGPLAENPDWSYGSELHSLYMVNTGSATHSQQADNPWYSAEGQLAAENGNIAASDWADAPTSWAINYWMTAPFHAVPMLDPELQAVGFGIYRDAAGFFRVAATLDINRGLSEEALSAVYPLPFPKDGGQTWVLKTLLPEFPAPLESCPGYARPTGPPIILQMGRGNSSFEISRHSLMQGDTTLENCIFDGTSYVNPDFFAQRSGRYILAERDAIVMIPRLPLEAGLRYTVAIVVNEVPITWSFDAVSAPQ